MYSSKSRRIWILKRNRTAGVEDRWKKTVHNEHGNTRTAPRAQHGKGSRWRARYVDANGKEHAKGFGRKADAQAWLNRQVSDQVIGTWTDPALSAVTLGAIAENNWVPRCIGRQRSHRAVYGLLSWSAATAVFGSEKPPRFASPTLTRGTAGYAWGGCDLRSHDRLVEGPTKNHTSRTVPVPGFVARLLESEISNRSASALVFPSARDSEYLTLGQARYAFQKATAVVEVCAGCACTIYDTHARLSRSARAPM